MKPKAISAIFLCALMLFQQVILAVPVDPSADSPKSGKNAAELADNADRAVAYIVRMGRQSKDPALSTDNEDAKPFWQAVKKINGLISKIERALFLKDDTFFANLAEATSAVEEIKITYGMTKAKDAEVKAGIEKLDAAVSLLRENFSKEAVRRKKGGKITEAEKKKLEEIKDKQAELQRKLKELEGKVGKNETLIEGIRQIKQKSRDVQHCSSDLSGFLFAMTTFNLMSGWIWGWHTWWGPWWGGWGPSFMSSFNIINVDVINVIDVDYDWGIVEDDILVAEELDLEVDMDEAEVELMDEYLDEEDFDYTEEEMVDFSADELDFEGEMDVYDLDEYEDYDFGDFDDGFDSYDGGFDDFDDSGFDDFDDGGFDDFDDGGFDDFDF